MLGAGVGFFASQVATGDWDDGPGRPGVNRTAWAAVGGSVGLTMGMSFPVLGGRSGGGQSARPLGRSLIAPEELGSISASSAFEVVRTLRPDWLVHRPPDTWDEPDSGDLRVYLDESWLGGVASLHGILVDAIDSIRFVDGPTAIMRWGVGHVRGVIQVVTRPRSPTGP